MPGYPLNVQSNGTEGWVNLNFMVDPNGKTYEIAVIQSTGNKALEESAIRAATAWTFEPASLNGRPVDASHEIKVIFRLTRAQGAQPGFVRNYAALNKALGVGDRAAADAAMSSLHVQNLYEDAYYGLGCFIYASLWGNEAEQMNCLERAVAKEKSASYIPETAFYSALQNLFPLQLKANHFSEALETWESLSAGKGNEKVLSTLMPAVEKLNALRTDDRSYAVAGEIGAKSWNLGLFKNRFHIRVQEGHVAQIKLRCQKKYVFFDFDPELEYHVAENTGKCGIEILGDSGTKFDLIQS